MKNLQKGSVAIWVIVIVVVLIGAGVYYFSQNKTSNNPITTSNNNSDWKTYTNKQFAFSFQYPSTFTAEQNDGDGSMPANNAWVRIYCTDTTSDCSGQEMDIYISPVAQNLEPQTVARVTTTLKNGNYKYAIATKNVYQETSGSAIVDRGSSINSDLAKQIISTIKFAK